MSVPYPDALRLLAEDSEDLEVVSAALQDALLKPSEIEFDPRTRQMTVALVRFRWETRARGTPQRVAAGLQINGVTSAKSMGVDRKEDTPLPLLAIQFEPDDQPPGGRLSLTLAGDAKVVLDVECLEVVLADISRPWPVRSRPDHRKDEPA